LPFTMVTALFYLEATTGKIYVFDRHTGAVIDTIDVGIKDWVQSVAGTNVVGKNDIMVWEKALIPPKQKTRKGFREEALLLMGLFSVLFVTENLLVRAFHLRKAF
jgi:hypothetical protein